MITTLKTALVASASVLLLSAFGCRDDSPPLTRPATSTAKPKASSENPANPAHVSKRESTPSTVDPAATETPAKSKAKPPAESPTPTVTATATGELIADLKMPKVALSEAHAKVCRIKVGDTLPTLTLTDSQGKSAPLAAQFGTAYSLVAFIRLADPNAGELLDDLERFVAPVFEPRGVKMVGVAIGAAPDAVAAAVKKKNIRLTLLSDAEGRALEQLTTDAARSGPWIYLIDRSGRVVWFDIEYSRSTRRDLQVALTLLTQSTRQARSN